MGFKGKKGALKGFSEGSSQKGAWGRCFRAVSGEYHSLVVCPRKGHRHIRSGKTDPVQFKGVFKQDPFCL